MIGLFPSLVFAAPGQASIVTRPGVVTAPIRYYFDLSSAMASGVNHAARVTISAATGEKTAIRFERVRLFDKSGAPVGTNVASKTDALSATPYAFVFQNFGIAAEELKNVAGVEISFLDLGGDNPTGIAKILGVSVTVTRDAGESCIIADPFIFKEKPIPTVDEIVNRNRPKRPIPGDGGGGGGGGGEEGGGGGGGGGTETVVITATMGSGEGSSSFEWANPAFIVSDNSSYATAVMGAMAFTGTTNYLIGNMFIGGQGISGATIVGIKVEVQRKRTDSGTVMGTVRDESIQFVRSGVPGTNKADTVTNWGTGETTATYGGPTELWGLSPWSMSSFTAEDGGATRLRIRATPNGRALNRSPATRRSSVSPIRTR